MSRLAALPPPGPVTIINGESAGRLLTITEFAEQMTISRAQVERLCDLGMPAIDVSIPRPGRRPKRCLRFDRAECLLWLRERGRS